MMGGFPGASAGGEVETAGMSAAHATTDQLQGRARRLRSQAASLHPVLAETYRRRAAELDRQAFLEAVLDPPIDLGDGPAPTAEHATVPAELLHLAVA